MLVNDTSKSGRAVVKIYSRKSILLYERVIPPTKKNNCSPKKANVKLFFDIVYTSWLVWNELMATPSPHHEWHIILFVGISGVNGTGFVCRQYFWRRNGKQYVASAHTRYRPIGYQQFYASYQYRLVLPTSILSPHWISVTTPNKDSWRTLGGSATPARAQLQFP